MNMPLVLLNRRRRGNVFTPSGLFALAEPGVWYDPSDVANLDWRRNLLTWTEQFDNAVWGTTNATVTPNDITAPDGTATADALVENTTSGNHLVRSASGLGSAAQHTVSCYLRAGTRSWAALNWNGQANAFAYFNLTGNGAVGTTGTGAVASISNVGGGWYRATLTFTLTAARVLEIQANPSDGVSIYTGVNAAKAIYIWGAQLELGSTATDYQRISDVNTEVIERFPTATLYQDTAGTTPVTTPGQTVALALDKSKGLVLGSELVTNGGFDSDTAWTKGSGWAISGGVATGATATASLSSTNSIGAVSGNTYMVTFTVTAFTSGSVRPNLGANVNGSVRVATGTYTEYLTPTGGDGRIYFVVSNFVGSIDNISVRELPGNHATQATAASRPTYGIVPATGRRNLLERTEEFDNAYWSKTAGSITANAGMAPNGTTTADKFIPNTSAVSHTVNRLVSSIFSAGGSVTFSCMVKADPYAFVGIKLYNQAYTGEIRATFNLTTLSSSTSTLGTAPTGIVATITDAGDGWRALRVSCTFATGTNVSASIDVNPTNSGVYGPDTAGDGTSGILIWGAQLETGSSATAYQRVGSAFDVTEAGVASLSYLSFDGVDDFLVTPTITPGIDKAQVFAGVRKLSDAAAGTALEFSDSSDTNNGAFFLRAPQAAAANYIFRSKGTVVANAISPSSYAAPITNVLTGLGDISGDVARLRINGAQVAETLTDQGTGNYLAYPLYIGRRAGTSLPFNGQLYSMIVRFGANLDAGTVTSTETWVNGKTGAYA